MARGVENRSVNFEKICAVNALSRDFVSGNISLEQAAARIENIHNTPTFKPLTRMLGYGLTSGGFSLISSQSLPDGIAAFFVGMLLGILQHFVNKRKAPYFLGSFLGGLVTATCACLFQLVLPFLHIDNIIIGGIMPLLPGLTMTKSIRDLLEGNFISGNSKMMEALLIAAAIAGGTATALGLFRPVLY